MGMQLHYGMRNRIDIDHGHTADGKSVVKRIEELVSPIYSPLLSDFSAALTLKWFDTSNEAHHGEVSSQKRYLIAIRTPNGLERVASISVYELLEAADMVQTLIRDMAQRMEKHLLHTESHH